LDESKIPELPPTQQEPKLILKKHAVPSKIRATLRRQPTAADDRSRVLFKLEGQLLEAGLSPAETYAVLQSNPWNKFTGTRTKQLWREIHKHDAAKAQVNNHKGKLRGVPFNKFMYQELPAPKWAVETIWSDEAHGIVAGEAKSYKTLIALDLAVSVASGTRFLDHFEVPETGPVMIVQSENEPGLIQDRVAKIAHSRELLARADLQGGGLSMRPGQDLPITFFNNPDLNLFEEEDIGELDQVMGDIQPKLAIFDPWYLLAVGVDENSSNQVAPILKALGDLKIKHNCGILLIHHFRKPKHDTEEGDLERISGTSVFGRWFQSALVVRRGDEPHSAKIVPYHREFPPQATIQVEFDIGDYDELDYSVDVEVKRETVKALSRHVRDLVSENQGITITELSEIIGVRKDRVRRVVEKGNYRMKTVKAKGKKGRPGIGVWTRS
jgi:hypothetical protein